MSYIPIDWVQHKTPINETNLDRMENGILEAHEAISAVNEAITETNSKVEQIARNQIPEEYLQKAVDDFISENESGLVTKTELNTLDSQLSGEIAEINSMIGEIPSSQNVSPNSYGQTFDGKYYTFDAYLVKNMYYRLAWVDTGDGLLGITGCTVSIIDNGEIVKTQDGNINASGLGIFYESATGWKKVQIYYANGNSDFWKTYNRFQMYLLGENFRALTDDDKASVYKSAVVVGGKEIGQSVPVDYDFSKPFSGKILLCYGDSITAQKTWQSHVVNKLGFSSYINKGVGGRRLMLMATDSCLAEITEEFDVITVMGGINDWLQDRPIGAIEDYNTDDQAFSGTFYGGLNALLDKLTTLYPTKLIVFMTPTPIWVNDSTKFYSKNGSGETNSNGNTIRDFAEAMIKTCEKWHVPYIDLNAMVGWNKNNISYYVQNEDNNFIHPNYAEGGERLGASIANGLEMYRPI